MGHFSAVLVQVYFQWCKSVVKVRVNAGALRSPTPIFSLCSSTWIQMLSVNYMLKSQ